MAEPVCLNDHQGRELPTDPNTHPGLLRVGARNKFLASKVNADIIASINEVVKIHEEGSRRRVEAQEELAKIEDELKNALLEAGSR